VPPIADASGLPPSVDRVDAALRADPAYQESGFAVADGPIGSYFVARGGVRAFGPPVSHAFPLLGSQVQIFRDHLLKVEPSGAVTTVDLFALGAIPFRNVGGRIMPEVDQALLATAPRPGTAEYGDQVKAFIRANAPDQWEGLPVGFHQAFLSTVPAENALPHDGDRALLPLFSLEVWGVPVSRPMRDAQNPDDVLLRWERGVMVWSRQSGIVTAVPLGEAFKAVLTGQGLDAERAAAAIGSPFLLQLSPASPDGVARPDELPDTVLANAFSPGSAAVNAAQLTNQYPQYPTPTMTLAPFPPSMNLTPTPTLNPFQPTPTLNPFQPTPLPGSMPGAPPLPGSVPGSIPGVPPQTGAPPLPGGMTTSGAPVQSGQATSDPCYGDEQITYSPEVPRVGNEVLVAVTSSRPHPYGRLAGTERTTFVRERPGQRGYVWEWTITLSYPGLHEYTFYVDSTIPCQKIQLTVRQQLATRTATPLPTPTPWGFDNGNGNSNNNGNTNDNFSTNDNFNSGVAPFINPSDYINRGDYANCNWFQSQAQAQSVLALDPRDPNQLDTENGESRDGVACRNYSGYPFPNDRNESPIATPVAAATQGPTATSGPTSTPQAFDPNTYLGQGDRYGCIDFASQAQAQAVLRTGFQNRRGDENKLDISSAQSQTTPDGVACNSQWDAPEWAASFFFPEPHDLTPVPR
jgi:hypothetical protein